MSAEQEFVSSSSITHDAAEILYNLAAEGQLAVESQGHDISEHRADNGKFVFCLTYLADFNVLHQFRYTMFFSDAVACIIYCIF